MKLPAIVTLGIILLVTFGFLWAITPKPEKTAALKPALPAPSVQIVKPAVTSIAPLSATQKMRVADMAQNWAKEPAYDADFNALDPSYKVASMTNSMFDPSDDYWGLPRDDKGAYELVDAYCTACHSASIVMQQRATAARWKELLIWMEDKQGMAKIPAEDEALVLDYISTYFSTK